MGDPARRRTSGLEDLPGGVSAVPALRYLEAAAGATGRVAAGGLGIVADDVMAGIYGALILYIGSN